MDEFLLEIFCIEKMNDYMNIYLLVSRKRWPQGGVPIICVIVVQVVE
jgi:hypothetical protein